MRPRPLTPKRQAFVAEYLKDFNATQAATRAGYSLHTAESQGSRLLSFAEVQRAIAAASAKARTAAVLTLAEAQEIASVIARDGVSNRDRLAALDRLSKFNGWDQPQRIHVEAPRIDYRPDPATEAPPVTPAVAIPRLT